MKITCEKSLRNFDFWGAACYTRGFLTFADLDRIEDALEEVSLCWTETEINDLFAFDSDQIAEILGYEDWETLEAVKPYPRPR